MCFCYVDSWLHKCHSGWTSGGLVNDSGGWVEGGYKNSESALGEGGCEATYVYNLWILYSNPLGVGGVVNISSKWWPTTPPPPLHCRPADQRPAPSSLLTWALVGRQLWRRWGVPHFWPPGLHKSEASPRQLGQPWQMLPLEGCWQFITKHIGILGCSWFRFSGITGWGCMTLELALVIWYSDLMTQSTYCPSSTYLKSLISAHLAKL